MPESYVSASEDKRIALQGYEGTWSRKGKLIEVVAIIKSPCSLRRVTTDGTRSTGTRAKKKPETERTNERKQEEERTEEYRRQWEPRLPSFGTRKKRSKNGRRRTAD